jgi:hypothetical protein
VSHPRRNHPYPGFLKITRTADARTRKRLLTTWTGLPIEPAAAVQVAFLPRLTDYRGKLLSGDHRGTPIYAAAFVRERRIVLETDLVKTPDALRFIFVHELFHLAWLRLGNGRREAFRKLLVNEIAANVRGELGESSTVKKGQWMACPEFSVRAPNWRDYTCESFCDSAASFYAAGRVPSGYKIGKAWTAIRRDWFDRNLGELGRWPV